MTARSLARRATVLCLSWFSAVGLACSSGAGPDASSTCEASNGTAWTYLGLEGRWVTALAETPWGIFAGTAYEGVFRLDVDSGSWQALGLDHAIVGAMAFAPDTTPRLLVGMTPHDSEQTPAAVFSSVDRGQTWVPWDGGLADQYENRLWAYSLAVDPGDPDRVYMGQSGAILRSLNGGRSWQYVEGAAGVFGSGLRSIVISPRRDGRVWAGGGGAMFNSLILLSTDWGDSWEPLIPRVGLENRIFALGVDERTPQRLWAGLRGGVIRSDDGGRTWAWALDVANGVIKSILVLDDRVYAVGSAFPTAGLPSNLALFCSADGGTTWSTVKVPADAQGSDVAVVDAEGRLLIGTVPPQGGVWRLVL